MPADGKFDPIHLSIGLGHFRDTMKHGRNCLPTSACPIWPAVSEFWSKRTVLKVCGGKQSHGPRGLETHAIKLLSPSNRKAFTDSKSIFKTIRKVLTEEKNLLLFVRRPIHFPLQRIVMGREIYFFIRFANLGVQRRKSPPWLLLLLLRLFAFALSITTNETEELREDMDTIHCCGWWCRRRII
jgi:hypothetical protein